MQGGGNKALKDTPNCMTRPFCIHQSNAHMPRREPNKTERLSVWACNAMQCDAMRCEPLCASHVEDKTSNRWVGKACSITMPHMMYIRRYMSSDQPAIPTAAHALTHTVVARPWFGCMPPTQSAIRWTAIDAMHPPLAFVRAGHTSDRCTYVLAGGILSF